MARTAPRYALFVAVVYAALVLLLRRVEVCGGFGGDSCNAYGPWALHFSRYVLESRVTPYSAARVLPSLVAHVLVVASGSRTEAAAVHAFQALNVALMAVTAVAWHRTARRLAIDEGPFVFSTIGLFGSFLVVRWSTYLPTLTDLWGLTLGAVLLFAVVERRSWLLAPLALAGEFAWPGVSYACLLAALFMRAAPLAGTERARRILRAADGALASAVGIACGLRLAPWALGDATVARELLPAVRMDRAWALPSTLVSAIAIAWIVWGLGPLQRLPLRPRARDVPPAVLVAIVVGLCRVAQAWLVRPSLPPSSHPGHALTTHQLVDVTLYTSVAEPGVFLVTHVMTIGVVGAALVVAWRDAIQRVIERAPAAGWILALALPLLLNSESRRLFMFLPVFTLAATLWIASIRPGAAWPWTALAWVLVAQLALSRIWAGSVGSFDDAFFAPSPWMTRGMYVVQLGCLLGLVAATWLLAHRHEAAQRAT